LCLQSNTDTGKRFNLSPGRQPFDGILNLGCLTFCEAIFFDGQPNRRVCPGIFCPCPILVRRNPGFKIVCDTAIQGSGFAFKEIDGPGFLHINTFAIVFQAFSPFDYLQTFLPIS
jgi:hypothetical protein